MIALEGLGKLKKKAVVDTSVNILGPRSLFDKVGIALEGTSSHLQHPIFLSARIQYINPHYFFLDEEPRDLRDLVGPIVSDDSSKRIATTIQDALASLDSPEVFSSIEDLPDSLLDSEYLKTQLKPSV